MIDEFQAMYHILRIVAFITACTWVLSIFQIVCFGKAKKMTHKIRGLFFFNKVFKKVLKINYLL